MTHDVRYPVGKVLKPSIIADSDRSKWIDEIEEAPKLLRAAVSDLSDEQLDTVYRPGGWTLRQVVHHVADSHINAYVRCRWALTEDVPKIKDYDEKGWARLPDARNAPIEMSLALLEAVHERWVCLLRLLSKGDTDRSVMHPENGLMSMDDFLAIYAWHGRHHTAHIMALRQKKDW